MKYPKFGSADMNGFTMPVRMATSKQLEYINALIEKLDLDPADYLEDGMTFDSAENLIDELKEMLYEELDCLDLEDLFNKLF